VLVLDRLGDPGDRRADARGAERHRLQQHRRQTVAVAVGADDARRGQHGRVLHERDDLVLGASAEQPDTAPEAVAGDPCGEVAPESALARDGAGEEDAPVAQDRARVDQQVKALLLDQATDRGDVRRADRGVRRSCAAPAGSARRRPGQLEGAGDVRPRQQQRLRASVGCQRTRDREVAPHVPHPQCVVRVQGDASTPP
jgi:hypothetical protein